MSTLTSPRSPDLGRPSPARSLVRWLVSFAGYPLGGFAALVVVGPVDDLRRPSSVVSSPA